MKLDTKERERTIGWREYEQNRSKWLSKVNHNYNIYIVDEYLNKATISKKLNNCEYWYGIYIAWHKIINVKRMPDELRLPLEALFSQINTSLYASLFDKNVNNESHSSPLNLIMGSTEHRDGRLSKQFDVESFVEMLIQHPYNNMMGRLYITGLWIKLCVNWKKVIVPAYPIIKKFRNMDNHHSTTTESEKLNRKNKEKIEDLIKKTIFKDFHDMFKQVIKYLREFDKFREIYADNISCMDPCESLDYYIDCSKRKIENLIIVQKYLNHKIDPTIIPNELDRCEFYYGIYIVWNEIVDENRMPEELFLPLKAFYCQINTYLYDSLRLLKKDNGILCSRSCILIPRGCKDCREIVYKTRKRSEKVIVPAFEIIEICRHMNAHPYTTPEGEESNLKNKEKIEDLIKNSIFKNVCDMYGQVIKYLRSVRHVDSASIMTPCESFDERIKSCKRNIKRLVRNTSTRSQGELSEVFSDTTT